MTIEFGLFIIVAAAYACYLVWKWQESAFAPPPYQEPVKEAPVVKEDIDANWPFPTPARRP
jgi:hypothetical protein